MANIMNFDPKEWTVKANHAFVMLATGFLSLRVLLRFFDVSADNGFVLWVYEMSETLLTPLRNVFSAQIFESTYVVDFVALFGIVFYMVLGLVVLNLSNRLTRK